MVSGREIEPHNGALRSFFLAMQKRCFLSIFGQAKETGSHRTEALAVSPVERRNKTTNSHRSERNGKIPLKPQSHLHTGESLGEGAPALVLMQALAESNVSPANLSRGSSPANLSRGKARIPFLSLTKGVLCSEPGDRCTNPARM